MSFRYTLFLGVMFAAGIAGAQAQSPFPPAGQGAFPSGGQAIIPGMQQQRQEQGPPPCFAKFVPLREDMEKHFLAAKTALNRKPADAADVCAKLSKLSPAQINLVKFVQQNDNPSTCPFPAGFADRIKADNAHVEEIRKQACAAASRPPRPAGPTLSDALSPPPPTKDNTKTGGGTLDSLFGNPIAR